MLSSIWPTTSASLSAQLRLGRHCFSRSFVNRAAARPAPPPTDVIASPQDFLKAIGRGLDTKISTEEWSEFWKTSGVQLRKNGLPVRDRRYALWCMNKYRNGVPLQEFVHEQPPKKTIRGWGPKIVNGKLNRSKRTKSKGRNT